MEVIKMQSAYTIYFYSCPCGGGYSTVGAYSSDFYITALIRAFFTWIFCNEVYCIEIVKRSDGTVMNYWARY
jgi:hypothetical protein